MYRFISFLISNRLFAIIFAISVALLAWLKLPELQISQYPDIDIPMLTVNLYLPGASSLAMESRVVDKVEEKLETLRRLKKVTSRITNSYAQVAIEYERGVDVDNEYTDVYARLNNLKSELPDDVEIVVLKQNPMDRVVSFVLSLSSRISTYPERISAAEELKRRLRNVNGLENLTVMKPEQEIRIALNLARMGVYGISIDQVSAAIREANQFLPSGQFVVGDKRITVTAGKGGFHQIDEIRNTMIIADSGSAITLGDIALVQQVPQEDAVFYQIGDVPAVWLTMKLNESANVFEVKKSITDLVREYEQETGLAMETHWLFDVEQGVASKLGQLLGSIFWGIAILAIVLLFAVGYRSAFIITMMLPVALLLSIVGLSLTGYGIQEISLAGFIISLGLIVDSGIVVTENAFKLKTYSGYSRQEAAITGTATVMTPLVSSTLTTALAFAPIFLLDSVTGLFLHSFVVTIWLCLAASLVAAVSFAAILLARIGTDNKVMGLPVIPSFMNGLKPFRDVRYVALVTYFIKKPLGLVLGVTLALGVSLYAATRLDVIIFPDSEEPYFTITIEADRDRSLGYVKSLASEVSALAREEADVVQCSSVVGATFPAVHTGIRWLPDAKNVGTVFCQVNFRDSARLNELTARLNKKLARYDSSAVVEAAAFINGDGVDDDDIELKLTGQNILDLRQEAIGLEDYLAEKNIAGIVRFNNPARSNWFSVKMKFKDSTANALGVSRAAVNQAMVLLLHGIEVDDFRDGNGNTLPVVLGVESSVDDPFLILDQVFVTSKSGNQIPLSLLVDVSYVEDNFDIYHEHFKPELALGIVVETGYSISSVTNEISAALVDYKQNKPVNIEIGGLVATSADAFGGAGRYVGIIGLMILGIFVFQFKSLTQPLIVLVAIPLSFIGGFILLWLTGQQLSFLAFVGLTSLMGIVINNSILLVDEGNRIFSKNPELSAREVAVEAGVNRFMPILLTSLTSICGLLPMALGQTMFKALALVIIGGLSTSTILTLLCVPVLYARLPRNRSLR